MLSERERYVVMEKEVCHAKETFVFGATCENFIMHALQLSPAKIILPRPLSAPSIMCFTSFSSSILLAAGDDARPAVSVTAVVDPLSRSAQKLSTILPLLRKSINCDVNIVLNPKSKLSEVPLKSFYRYVAMPHLQFDINGEVIENQARITVDDITFVIDKSWN
ncbi:hypothetical protein V3C99_018065 [Haemonchus contortus]